jgi:hypothetical protein
MKTVEEIENDINNMVNNYSEDRLWIGWFRAVSQGILPEELKSLCDAWRDGRVMVLPCKIGDTIYVIPSKTNYRLNIVNGHSENNKIYEQTVGQIEFFEEDVYVLITCNGLQCCHSKFYKLNWFLTKPEAEAALEGKIDGFIF